MLDIVPIMALLAHGLQVIVAAVLGLVIQVSCGKYDPNGVVFILKADLAGVLIHPGMIHRPTNLALITGAVVDDPPGDITPVPGISDFIFGLYRHDQASFFGLITNICNSVGSMRISFDLLALSLEQITNGKLN